MSKDPRRPSSLPFWRDPIIWLPIVTIVVAATLFGLSWRQFGPHPPAAPGLTITAPPPLALGASDPAALALLRQMEAAMNRLHSLKSVQVLRDDTGTASVTTTILYAWPDKVLLTTNTGEQSIGIDNQQWARSKNETLWSTWMRPEPLHFPDFNDSQKAIEVQFGEETGLADHPVQTLRYALVVPEGRFDFKVYADAVSLLFRRTTMDGPGHHMVTDFVDYGPSVTITPPPANLTVPTPTPVRL